MNTRLKNTVMIGGMVIAWSIYYAVSKIMVDATASPYAAGFLLRMGALVFLTVQLCATGNFLALFRQGRTVLILIVIGACGRPYYIPQGFHSFEKYVFLFRDWY